ncbi:GFA family protein [Acinetobacter stercoris]|uniref:Glutathione-dependent formaldehyde-activating enzyme n=1 Tax=Acinetobacter stercoris TaxID=2126983 RepID=A0A2U3MU67_9GAMM|nr:GFA family protein [Acinetobacter stercoris]SPL68903.1 Glutathione-dependent formaldehyde-activating enzyme [Acinetobacter stercoris]
MEKNKCNNIQGGGFCGAVRYETIAKPRYSINCHCRDCQKITGSAYAPLLSFFQSEVIIKGKVQYFDSNGKSGKRVRRGFCPKCGSRLFSLPEMLAGIISIHVGTLDEPNLFEPKAELFISQANHWDVLNPNILHFEELAKK